MANPIPSMFEVSTEEWTEWFREAQSRTAHVRGRDTTPALLGALHEISGGKTLHANIELVKSNTRLAARLAARSGS